MCLKGYVIGECRLMIWKCGAKLDYRLISLSMERRLQRLLDDALEPNPLTPEPIKKSGNAVLRGGGIALELLKLFQSRFSRASLGGRNFLRFSPTTLAGIIFGKRPEKKRAPFANCLIYEQASTNSQLVHNESS